MRLLETPSRSLVNRLNRRSIGGYLRVASATSWANREEALAQVDVDELSTETVRAFLDMPEDGEKEVEPYSDAVLMEYFGEYLPTAKSFFIPGGRREFAGFAAQWMLLQSNPMAITKVRGSLIIAGWENRALDWAAMTSAALIREATDSRKYRAAALAYWLGMFYTPPPGKERPGSRQRDQRTPEEEAGNRRKQQAKAVVPADNAGER
jgi:hypothetical protein